jgi:hypothetical protein
MSDCPDKPAQAQVANKDAADDEAVPDKVVVGARITM